MDKKLEELEQSKERVHNQIEALNSKEEALDELQASIVKELEKVSNMTTEEAIKMMGSVESVVNKYSSDEKNINHCLGSNDALQLAAR